MPTKTAARRPQPPTPTAPRPDRSPAGIAWRREQMEHALADSMIERNYAGPEALAIFERWVLGELNEAETDAALEADWQRYLLQERALADAS
jgi:hypothetical protein